MWIRTLKPYVGGVPSRVLKLQGGQNFRDLGGYPASGGSTVRRYQIFRSAGLDKLTLSDYRRIDRLELKGVFDLRTPEERQALPTVWAGVPVKQMSFPAGESGSMAAMAATFAAPGLRSETVTAFMLDLYRRLPYEHAPAYSSVFKHLADKEFPLLFHCAAGKDRTGVLAALILSVLGVPENLVVEDYSLSARIVNYREELGLDDRRPGKLQGHNILRELPVDVVAPLLQSHPDYIIETLSEVKRRYGNAEHFVKVEYGVTEGQLYAIRNNLLE